MNCTISESSKFWTHIALPGLCLVVCLVECPWTQLGLQTILLIGLERLNMTLQGSLYLIETKCPAPLKWVVLTFTVIWGQLAHNPFPNMGSRMWKCIVSLFFLTGSWHLVNVLPCTLGWCVASSWKSLESITLPQKHIWTPLLGVVVNIRWYYTSIYSIYVCIICSTIGSQLSKTTRWI